MTANRGSRFERAPAGVRRRRVDRDDEYEDFEYEYEYEDDDYEPTHEEPTDEPDEEPDEELDDEPDQQPDRRESRGRLSAQAAGEAGLRLITGIVSKDVEGVTAVRPSDGGWTVEVELLDARHIPSSSDTLALYEVELDDSGELMSYRRTAMYSRARGREAR